MQLVLDALRSLAAIANLPLLDNANVNQLPYPGLPIVDPPASSSYWIAHNRGLHNTLNGHGKFDDIPRHADVVMSVITTRHAFELGWLLRRAPPCH